MDATLYIDILRGFLFPFIEEKFQGSGNQFMQDNDPKHTSNKAKECYEQQGINWWTTPASSADVILLKECGGNSNTTLLNLTAYNCCLYIGILYILQWSSFCPCLTGLTVKRASFTACMWFDESFSFYICDHQHSLKLSSPSSNSSAL